MCINYKKVEHLKLLKKLKFGILNSENSKKLLMYFTLSNGYLDWCISEHSFKLLENF